MVGARKTVGELSLSTSAEPPCCCCSNSGVVTASQSAGRDAPRKSQATVAGSAYKLPPNPNPPPPVSSWLKYLKRDIQRVCVRGGVREGDESLRGECVRRGEGVCVCVCVCVCVLLSLSLSPSLSQRTARAGIQCLA